MIRDPEFINYMDEKQARAWLSFVEVVRNFLGNHRAENYRELVGTMLDAFRDLGCRMSIKMHYLHAHLDTFPENLGQVSDGQGERSHQDISTMEERYQGRWDEHMMADYCWDLMRSNPEQKYSGRAIGSRFLPPPE